MATTPTYGIVYPTTSNSITPLANHFAALANSVDAGLAQVGSRMIGTDAERLALTAPRRKAGLTWYSTDTKREWQYDGSNWVSGQTGLVRLWPTAVGGATISSDGTIIPSASTITVDGVFSSNYRRFKIEGFLRSSTATSENIQLRIGGSTYTGGTYTWQTIEVAGSGIGSTAAPSGYNADGQPSWPFGYQNKQNRYFTVELWDIASSGSNRPKAYHADTTGHFPDGNSRAIRFGAMTGQDSTSYDGFQINSGQPADAASSFIKVYAYV